MFGLSTAFHRRDTKDYEVYGCADRETLREILCKEKKQMCVDTT
jgi:hypothetical protein